MITMVENVIWTFVIALALNALSFLLGIRATLNTLSRMERNKLNNVIRALRDEEDDAEDTLPESATRLSLTAVGDIILAHDANTGEFLAQGKNTKELLSAAFARYPGRHFTIAVEEESTT